MAVTKVCQWVLCWVSSHDSDDSFNCLFAFEIVWKFCSIRAPCSACQKKHCAWQLFFMTMPVFHDNDEWRWWQDLLPAGVSSGHNCHCCRLLTSTACLQSAPKARQHCTQSLWLGFTPNCKCGVCAIFVCLHVCLCVCLSLEGHVTQGSCHSCSPPHWKSVTVATCGTENQNSDVMQLQGRVLCASKTHTKFVA